MARAPGLSARWKLTLSYAGFLMVAGALLIAAVWLFLIRGLPDVTTSAVGILNFRGRIRHAYLPATAVVLLFLLVFGLVGGWVLAGRMLAPLSRIAEATRMAADGSLSYRIGLPGCRDEFRDLADSFDAMLARLEAHVEAQRRFAADASHELRTPLAATRAMLDVAARDPGRDRDVLVIRLTAVNERAIALTEALLTLSRADGRAFDREPVDLSLAVDDVVETLLPLAETRGVAVEVTDRPVSVLGADALIRQLVSTLVHNAIVHNRPDGGTVRIRAESTPERALLVVENTGDTIDAATVATLVEPFRRGAGRVHRDDGGVGLGLAIADRITTAHDGSLTLAPRTEGGLRVTVRLPAAVAA